MFIWLNDWPEDSGQLFNETQQGAEWDAAKKQNEMPQG